MAYLFKNPRHGTYYAGIYLPGSRRTIYRSLFTKDKAIAQAAIKNIPGPGRRHLVWPKDLDARIEGCGCVLTKKNSVLASRAFEILRAEPQRFSFLLEPKAKHTILCALGRESCVEFLKKMADELCKEKMSSSRAGIFVRQWRNAQRKELPKLSDYIQTAIRRYFEHFPESPYDVSNTLSAMAIDFQTHERKAA